MCSHPKSFVIFKVAKAVYKNKDWNINSFVYCFLSCPKLQKLSTKTRIETKTTFSFIKPPPKVAKAVYKNKDWNIISSGVSQRTFKMLQKRSTKTRIETSNLLEKGLIQKTVYLVKWNFTKSNCVVFFLRSKNNHVSLVKLSFLKKGCW